jgi:hypothetical protein
MKSSSGKFVPSKDSLFTLAIDRAAHPVAAEAAEASVAEPADADSGHMGGFGEDILAAAQNSEEGIQAEHNRRHCTREVPIRRLQGHSL